MIIRRMEEADLTAIFSVEQQAMDGGWSIGLLASELEVTAGIRLLAE